MEEQQTKENIFQLAWAQFLLLVILAGLLAVVIIWGWQIYHWLRTGHWQSLSVSTSLTFFGINDSSLYLPSNWEGVAKIGRWAVTLPLVFEPIAAVIAAVFAIARTDASNSKIWDSL